ncbi:MAG: phosphatase PAP2 family protein [Prolixibacteraceae bacterium]
MALFEALNKIDTQWLLAVNGVHNEYFDVFFAFFTSKEVWFPFYLVLLSVIFIKYKRAGFFMALMLILTIVLADQGSVLIKDSVMRLRPSHALALEGRLNLPVGPGGLYGFVSSHATNAFALATMIGLVSKCGRVWIAFILWALLTGYSRIYVGVHYPFDVLGGALLGAGIAYAMYRLMIFMDHRYFAKRLAFAGSCENHQIAPVLITLVMISVTLGIAAMLVLKYQL